MMRTPCLLLLLAASSLACAQDTTTISEKDFLDEMPVVLSVSRLPQRLDETPGAVTLLDRQMIRLSGARDVADLLRLVPGFRVTNSFEGDAPQGGYHFKLIDDYFSRMQVLVDGRSVYSPYMLGGIGNGLQTVALEDIERIEVVRGSNSAAYGARAFLGTINIVTRDTVDTMGVQAKIAGGDNSIQDSLLSLGWGNEAARFRLGADQRGDRGFSGSSGPDQVNRVNFRADLRPSASDQIELRLGQTAVKSGIGFSKSGEEGNAPRNRLVDTAFAQLDWRRNLNPDEDIALQLAHTQEKVQNAFPYKPISGVVIDFGGESTQSNLLLQHTFRKDSRWRFVWGGELREERLTSRPLYNTGSEFVTGFTRLFGNAEWRMHKALILNAGGMFERSNMGGESFSPRAMLNWHFSERQTLRYGVSQAVRPPSIYEKYANTRYYLNGQLLESTFVSRGNVEPEKILTREIGYLGDFPDHGFNLDVRLFEEYVQGAIDKVKYPISPDGLYGDGVAKDFINKENFSIRGAEYQLKWRPWQGGQLIWHQSFFTSGETIGTKDQPRPFTNMGLMYMHKLPGGADLSLMYHQVGPTYFSGSAEAPAISRTDLRIAWPLRFGARRGELALVAQNLGPAYQDFLPDFYFRQQTYVTLRLEN